MKYIFLNLKRFDISPARGGVNRLYPMDRWGAGIVRATQEALCGYAGARFVMFFPEAHLLGARAALEAPGPVELGCQGVCAGDTAPGGNFGAFTGGRTANAARELGCGWALIGHCEERVRKLELLSLAGVAGTAAAAAVNRALGQEVRAAQAAGLSVLYCVGERLEERPSWREVLSDQLTQGLDGADLSRVVVGYEPVWSIGPGRTPADAHCIQETARWLKSRMGGVPVVYGGGLKLENAGMLAGIEEIDGGLIALTRFSGEIGFYPDEFLQIVEAYLGH